MKSPCQRNFQQNQSAALVGIVVALGVITACSGPVPPTYNPGAGPENLYLTNGQWFDGNRFVQRDFSVIDGYFSDGPAPDDARYIDLDGGFVVPPFGEAHQHNIDADNGRFEILNQAYLQAGVFYLRNPNNLPRTLPRTIELVASVTTIDAAFSGGGVTGPGGHPVQIAERNVSRGAWTRQDVDGGFVYEIDDRAELEARWPMISAAAPDFIKTYLLYSEEYAARAEDEAAKYWRGLDPSLLHRVVELAHADGLRVSTHIESAADFRTAVAAGVDDIIHMPGFRTGIPGFRHEGPEPASGYAAAAEITATDAEAAAASGINVATTVAAWAILAPTARHNLRMLRDAGVKIVVGTDRYEETATDEIESLALSGLFSELELLRMWAVDTPMSIFPDRKIGRLADGYEASLLVLDGNPLEDIDAIFRIRLGIKQGHVILTPGQHAEN